MQIGVRPAHARRFRRASNAERIEAFAVARALCVVADPADGRGVARAAGDQRRRDIGGRAAEARPFGGAREDRRRCGPARGGESSRTA